MTKEKFLICSIHLPFVSSDDKLGKKLKTFDRINNILCNIHTIIIECTSKYGNIIIGGYCNTSNFKPIGKFTSLYKRFKETWYKC